MSFSYKLREIFEVMGEKIPDTLTEEQLNKSYRRFVVLKALVKPRTILFASDQRINLTKDYYDEVTNAGAEIVFVSKDIAKRLPIGDRTNIIVLDDFFAAQGKFFNHYLRRFNIPTIAVTGSIGQTTTTESLKTIFAEKYHPFQYPGNQNTFRNVATHIARGIKPENDFFIQECCGAEPQFCENGARMLCPDAYVITNILPHHLDKYKTVDAIEEDKTSLSKYVKEGGFVVTNFDDDRLANHNFGHRVISTGIKTDRDVDYRGKNIVQHSDRLEMDIEDRNGHVFHAAVPMLGIHNAYNMILAYAMAREFDIDDESIRKGFMSYSTAGIRQNLVDIAGISFYLDCYNVSADSIISGVRTLESIDMKPGKKKIALLGGENKLGEVCAEKTFALGKALSDAKVDWIICYTLSDNSSLQNNYYGDGRELYRGLKEGGFTNCELITDREALRKRIYEFVKPGDLILYKGIYFLDMPTSIDETFGSSIIDRSGSKLQNGKFISEGEYEIFKLPQLTGGSVRKVKEPENGVLEIPEVIAGIPVHRIARNAFKGNEAITGVDFGTSLKGVGRNAFMNCTGIKVIDFPKNVLYVNGGAFMGCTGLQSVSFVENEIGQTIDDSAFAGCTDLTDITLPGTVRHIAANAFRECEKVCIHCYEDSYAHHFAEEVGIRFELIREKKSFLGKLFGRRG